MHVRIKSFGPKFNATYSPELRLGKLYRVVGNVEHLMTGGSYMEVVDADCPDDVDLNGEEVFYCRMTGCAHLGGGSWEIVDPLLVDLLYARDHKE